MRGSRTALTLTAVAALTTLQAPAHTATPEPTFYGHRCHTYATATNENTPTALADIANTGAGCEIDVWSLPGCNIVFHDNTWKRVADPATLTGIPMRVLDTTCEQVKQIRTKGGRRIPTLVRMTRAAVKRSVPLLIEIKNGLPTSAVAELNGARVSFYQQPSPTCRLGSLDAWHALGYTTGVKTGHGVDCPMTPEQVAAHGSFVVDGPYSLTADRVAAYKAEGLRVLPKCVARDGWAALRAVGVREFIVNHPRQAVRWS